MDLVRLKDEIISHPYFQKLKDVVENNSYHADESAYEHSLKTAEIAESMRDGHFITNTDARKLFTDWLTEDFHGIKKGDIAVLIALLHDCGKILTYTENGITFSINTAQSDNTTSCPGHEYWGGRLVAPEILKDVPLAQDVKKLIIEVIKAHDTFNEQYFSGKKHWPFEQLLSHMKSQANGYFEDALFNIYCDNYAAAIFEHGKTMIEKLFNDPRFYDKRRYQLP